VKTKDNDNDAEIVPARRLSTPYIQRVSVSRYGMVSTAHYRATEAGAEVLGAGGNAMDAAVASALALGVCEPHGSGLGGQTFMTVYMADKDRVFALDGSSRVPNRATMELFEDKEVRLHGYTASTVPSTPAVLSYALKRYGTMPAPQVLAPAVRLAEEGFEVTPLQHLIQKREKKVLLDGNAAEVFLKDGQRPYPAGSILTQPALAGTLKRLAEAGIEDFYTGEIAEAIHKDMQKNGGFIQKDDLARIPYPIEREPVSCRYGKMKVFTMPPPGAGRTLIEMLKILRRFPPKEVDPDSTEGVLLLAETMRRAQLDRRDRPFDPNFYPQVDDERMLSPYYTKMVSKQIASRVTSSGETTHLSVADRHGNMVALTQSIERVYGAKVATPTLGFLYNNYMSALEYKDMTNPYYLRPNGVPWASVAPTIVFSQNKPWVALGSPGSDRIASAILQVIIRMSRKEPPLHAVLAPRMHSSFNGKVSLEAAWMRDDLPKILIDNGFTLDAREPLSFYLGCVQMVVSEEGGFTGIADPRRDGSASGPVK
jgi:gamma-glutamyltranspeptidase/glutathione hydrolase